MKVEERAAKIRRTFSRASDLVEEEEANDQVD